MLDMWGPQERQMFLRRQRKKKSFLPTSSEKSSSDSSWKCANSTFYSQEHLGLWRKPPLDLQSWFFLFLSINSLNHSVSGNLRNLLIGASLVVQWMRPCALNAKEPGSIPDEGIRSHMLQMRLNMLQLKIPHARRKIEDPMWCNLDLVQPNKEINIFLNKKNLLINWAKTSTRSYFLTASL